MQNRRQKHSYYLYPRAGYSWLAVFTVCRRMFPWGFLVFSPVPVVLCHIVPSRGGFDIPPLPFLSSTHESCCPHETLPHIVAHGNDRACSYS